MCIHAALLFKAETQLQIYTAFLSDKANMALTGCPFWPSMKQSFPGLLTLSPQNRRASHSAKHHHSAQISNKPLQGPSHHSLGLGYITRMDILGNELGSNSNHEANVLSETAPLKQPDGYA